MPFREDTAADLDRRLRALSGRAARCRLAEGWLAGTLLSRRSWFALGFVRLGDYTSERLGLGARVLEEEARIARLLRGLPKMTAAFLDGSLPWTALRMVAGVATAGDEDRWIVQARSLDTRGLAALVRESALQAGAGGAETGTAGGAEVRLAGGTGAGTVRGAEAKLADGAAPGAPFSQDSGAGDEDELDPRQRWEVLVSRSGRRLWRAACEMAQRTAGSSLSPAQVLEQVAAEAASGAGSPESPGEEWPGAWSDEGSWTSPRERSSGNGLDDPGGRSDAKRRDGGAGEVALERPRDFSLGLAADGMETSASDVPRETGAAPVAVVFPVRAVSLAEALAAEIARNADSSLPSRLSFLTLERAQELDQDDPELAAFYVEMLTGDAEPTAASAGPATDLPAEGWFEEALRGIGLTEGFSWLAELSTAKPRNSSEWVEAEMRAIEALDPHTIDARLREVRRSAQALDSELSALLREAADRRIHRDFGLPNFEAYVETRVGLGARTAWSLLAIQRAVRRGCPLLGEAWRTGRVSTLAARILLPVVGGPHAREWIARAGMVTLRRLEAEVTWTLQRHDAEPSSELDGSHGLQMRAPAPVAGADLAPPPLDQDLTGAVLAGVTRRELQMRARPADQDSAADNAESYRPSARIVFHAPESVILLAEQTMQSMRSGFEPRGRAFERMIATALLEWMAAPKHRDPVFERDGWRCAVPGCGSRRSLHDHHVVFRSNGGDNTRDNRITVCAAHHLHGLHRGRIRARGRAPHAITWELGCRFGHDAGRPMARLVGDRYVEGN